MKLVKIARVGGKLVEVCVDGNARVSDVLRIVNMTKATNEDIFINHNVVSLDTQVLNNDVIILEARATTRTIPNSRRRTARAIEELIDVLIEYDMVEPEYHNDDEDDEIDYDATYDDYCDAIDDIIIAVRSEK